MNNAVLGWFHTLSDTAYDLWLRDELAEQLRLRDGGTRVEVIGGQYVVSPGADFAHNSMVQDIVHSLVVAEIADPAFPWRCIHTMDLDLGAIRDGYIPDLAILTAETDARANRERLKQIRPEHVALAVEVTSPSTAGHDRPPSGLRLPSKWVGYAKVGIPYYLLVDRDPRAAQTTLYSHPDRGLGEYKHQTSWEFGETIRLPEPFGFEIPTDEWRSWA